VSAGFDAAEGTVDSLGGFHVTPDGFAVLTRLVTGLALELGIPLAMVLEGGYDLPSLCASAGRSIRELLPPVEKNPEPLYVERGQLSNSFVELLDEICLVLGKWWKLHDGVAAKFAVSDEWMTPIQTRKGRRLPRRDMAE